MKNKIEEKRRRRLEINWFFYFCDMYYSYVLYNLEHHRFHYGFTVDLKKTEQAHNDGLIEETKGISPWAIVYHEPCGSKNHAIRRIRFYRTPAGQHHLRRILNF